MNFKSQASAILQLKQLAESDRHSILIEGFSGSGKTYLAKMYSEFINISDFQIVEPSVKCIRDAIDECIRLNTTIVLCIENIDSGVLAASYTLLKFLEEPLESVYVIITAENRNKVPDTIISRSAVVSTSPPLESDISTYAEAKDSSRYNEVRNRLIWKAVKSFSDAIAVMNLTNSQIDYIESLNKLIDTSEPISSTLWKLGHFDDNSEVPIKLLMNYIIVTTSGNVRKSAIECSNDLSGRIANHAVLAKFLFDCKYNS